MYKNLVINLFYILPFIFLFLRYILKKYLSKVANILKKLIDFLIFNVNFKNEFCFKLENIIRYNLFFINILYKKVENK